MTELVPIEDAAVNYARSPLSARQAYVGQLAQASHLLPRAVVNQQSWESTAAATFYIAEVGAMMGIHPLEALSGIHLIEGRWTISAGLMSSLVRQAGHKLRVTESGSWRDGTYVARCSIVRKDDPEFEHVSEFGHEDAVQANLHTKKGPWATYPKAMCKARAISACARQAAEDALGGARYTPEELGAEVNEEGEVIVVEATPHRPAPTPPAAAPPAASAPEAAPAPAPANGTASAAAPAPEQVPDERILAEIPETVLVHARSAWELYTSTDTDAITGVWKSAQAARIMGHPAIGFDDDGNPTVWERDETGKPKMLGVMLRYIGSVVAGRSKVDAETAAAGEPETDPSEPVDAEVVDAEVIEEPPVSEGAEGDPSAN